jgi:Flp pilus assembly protein CpaB
VVGRVSAVGIYLQQPITPNLLASSTAGGQFSILEPNETVGPDSPTWRAVAINVPDDRAVGGQIQANQRVDVFVTVQVNVATGGAALATAAPPGATPRPTPSGSPSSEPSGSPSSTPAPDGSAGPFYTDKSTKITYQNVPVLARNGSLYIIRVDARTAEEINHLAAAGNSAFSLALRPEADSRAIEVGDYGETTNRIIEKYGLPIPEAYPVP